MAEQTRQPLALVNLDGTVITIVDAYTGSLTFANTITSAPVETGSDVSDHSRPEPLRVSVECWISDSPLTDAQKRNRQSQDSRAAFEAIRDLHLNPKVFNVIGLFSSLGSLSMGIESSTFPLDTKSVTAVHWTMGLKEVRFVENQLTRATVMSDHRGPGKIDKGSKPTTDAPPPTQNTKTIAIELFQSLSSLF